MRISFVIPSRNNLKYLQQAVNSILDHYDTNHDIVLLDDASTDGTWEWIQSLQGDHFVKYRNEGPDRVGHTILYDKGVEISKTEVFSILHADMVVSPNYVSNLLKHLERKKVVCATRVEPPLHPPGPEKYVRSFGLEPEEFDKDAFHKFVWEHEYLKQDEVTDGIFAPWCMYKEDFQAIEGHDKLFAPMELEDSDIFNRMFLAGYKLVQSRDAFVYHMTCRGSRFKDGLEIEAEIPLPDGTIWYKPKDSEEYKALRAIKFKEWWRKWGCNVLHNELMLPIVPPKYDIAFRVSNCSLQALSVLEPWCSVISSDASYAQWIEQEQKMTMFDMWKRVKPWNAPLENDIIVEFDMKRFTQESYPIIQQLSQILAQSGEVGEFELDIFKVKIKALNTYQDKLITNSDPYYTNQLL
jgi:glycosyltransferase involved in cell wall biosynthesis